MRINSPKIFRFIITVLVIALCNFGAFNSSTALATALASTPAGKDSTGKSKDDPQIAGQLISSGIVTVNDKRAISGTTIFTNARVSVACTKGSSAIINLGRLGRIELAPGAKMVVRFSDGLISGDLLEGKAVVSTTAGTKVSINTPDGVTSLDGQDPAVTPVNSQRGVRCVPIPMGSNGGSSSAIGAGALAAILVGLGGAAAAGAVVATASDNSFVSPILP